MNTKAIRSVATLLRGIHAPYDRRQPFGFDGGDHGRTLRGVHGGNAESRRVHERNHVKG